MRFGQIIGICAGVGILIAMASSHPKSTESGNAELAAGSTVDDYEAEIQRRIWTYEHAFGMTPSDAQMVVSAEETGKLRQQQPCLIGPLTMDCVRRGSNEEFCTADSVARGMKSARAGDVFGEAYRANPAALIPYVKSMKADCLSDPARYRKLRAMFIQHGED